MLEWTDGEPWQGQGQLAGALGYMWIRGVGSGLVKDRHVRVRVGPAEQTLRYKIIGLRYHDDGRFEAMCM